MCIHVPHPSQVTRIRTIAWWKCVREDHNKRRRPERRSADQCSRQMPMIQQATSVVLSPGGCSCRKRHFIQRSTGLVPTGSPGSQKDIPRLLISGTVLKGQQPVHVAVLPLLGSHPRP